MATRATEGSQCKSWQDHVWSNNGICKKCKARSIIHNKNIKMVVYPN